MKPLRTSRHRTLWFAYKTHQQIKFWNLIVWSDDKQSELFDHKKQCV